MRLPDLKAFVFTVNTAGSFTSSLKCNYFPANLVRIENTAASLARGAFRSHRLSFVPDFASSTTVDKVGSRALTHDFSGLHAFDSVDTDKDRRSRPKLTWEDKFALLKIFKKVHGHCNVPPGYVVGGIQLGGWVETQRKEYRKHQLGISSLVMNERRLYRLERNGFKWNLSADFFQQKIGDVLTEALV